MKFRTALIVSMVVLFGAVVAALFGGISGVVSSYARQGVDRDLARSRRIVSEVWSLREAVYQAESQRMAEDPRLRAVVATAEIDVATAVGVASDISRAIGADLFLLVDQAGNLLADTHNPDAGSVSLTHLPLVRETLDEGRASGLMISDEGVFQVRGARMQFGETVVGAVLVGRRIDGKFASSLRDQTGALVSSLLGKSVVVTSRGEVPALGETAMQKLRRAEAEQATVTITLDGVPFVATSMVVAHASDGKPLRIVLLRSLAEAMEVGRRLEKVVTLVAAGGLLIAVLLAFLLARRLSGPLDELVRVVDRVGAGDLSARAGRSSIQETNTLARSFNQMTAELQESRAQMEVKQRLEKEMEIANVLQTAMLPRSMEGVALDIAARMVPASEVGGDYYDVITSGATSWIGIGDVAGHGLPAGIVMMMMQTATTALVTEDPGRDPSSVVVALNRLLYHNVRTRLDTTEHATFTLFKHESEGRFTYAGAHESFFIHRRARGELERVRTRGTWLAVAEDVDHVTSDCQLELAPGDTAVLFTDGMFEATNAEGEMFGLQRVEQTLEDLGPLHERPTQEILDRLFEVLERWASSQDDDRTAVVLRYTGESG